MKIIITGGYGAIASELLHHFKKEKKNKIFLISKKKQKNKNQKNFKVFYQDLSKPIKLNIKADLVIHCASKHYFSDKKVDKKHSKRINLEMSKNLTKFCNKNKIKKLIFLSSIDVYGSPKRKKNIFSENSKLKPENWYAMSKLKSERIFLNKKNKFNTICLRIPGVIVSSKFRNFPVLNKIINQIRNDEDVKIFNKLEMFNNVIDTLEIFRVIKKLSKKIKFTSGVFNLSASKPIRFLKIVKNVKKIFKSKSKIINIKTNRNSFLISSKKLNKIHKINIGSTDEIVKRFCNKELKFPLIALNGGQRFRKKEMPPRKIFGKTELNAVKKVFQNSWKTGRDFGFEGKYEKSFTEKFCKFQGGGYADAVSSGGAAIYIALKSLDIKPGSDVIVSPVCNPGGIMPVAIQDIKMIIPDSNKNSFNISPKAFEKAITKKTKAAVLTHLGGHVIDMDPIIKIAKKNNIKIVEDCSQAHGAMYKGKKVGTFGDIAAFSNGYSKNLAAGGTSGLIYTKSENLYWKARSIADRGKPLYKKNFNFRMTTDYLFPSNNYNADELTCAIGVSNLKKLPGIIKKRHEIANRIDNGLKTCECVMPTNLELKNTKSSIFFHTVMVDLNKIYSNKLEFAKAVAAEGVPINYDYRDITSEWKWTPKYSKNFKKTLNAIDFRDRTFNILLNEKYKTSDVKDIIQCIKKVERYFLK